MDDSSRGSIVLVSGGFLGAWVWDDVIAELDAAGIRAHALELTSVGDATPLGDLRSDAQSVRDFLDGLEYPVVLCGHSYGGTVITEAGAGPHPAVAQLVYLAGAAPAPGQSMAELATAKGNSSSSPAEEGKAVVMRDDGTGVLVAQEARSSLFGDCGADRAAAALRRLRPFNLAVGTQPVSAAAWLDLPTTFVRCSQDQLPELVDDGFLERETTDIIEMPTGHCPQWSRPNLVARLLGERLAAAVRTPEGRQ